MSNSDIRSCRVRFACKELLPPEGFTSSPLGSALQTGGGAQEGTFSIIAVTAAAAAIRVSQLALRKYLCTCQKIVW